MNPVFASLLVVVVAAIGATSATNGVDVSTPVSVEAWKCIKNKGNKFAIVRVYQSNGQIDPNGAQTIKNAHAAKIEFVDAYIFPSQKKGDPKGQIRDVINHLKDKDAKFGQLWIDVEGKDFWSNKPQDNVKFIEDLVEQAKAMGVKVAMYTSKSQWEPITKDSKKLGDLPLWYAHYNGEANFNGFQKFGSWEKPAIKQYKGTTPLCTVQVDLNWYP